MPEQMLGIRELLAQNLKINRRRCGLTQGRLVEKAGISAHYLAMVEVARKFPTPEMLDRLAQALDIETYKLFEMSTTPAILSIVRYCLKYFKAYTACLRLSA
ncbi:hypothetical protein FACS189493_5490 [Spirochaetia bacterium]|nr:hypothetical protein FACS189493_5490 [Spirochaetia bacterium]